MILREHALLLFTDNQAIGDRLERQLGQAQLVRRSLAAVSSQSFPWAPSAGQYALIFLHLADGGEAAQDLLRKVRLGISDTPLLVLLPDAEAHRAKEYLAYGVDDYLLLSELEGPAPSRLVRHVLERRQLRQQAAKVREAASALSTTLDLSQVLDLILFHLQKVVPFDSAEVFLRKEDRLQVVATGGPRADAKLLGKSFPAESPLFDHLRERRRPLIIEDVHAERSLDGWGIGNFIGGWMGVPLSVGSRVIGFITLNSERVGAYGDTDANLAQTFANQASIALRNAGLFNETSRRAQELGALVEVSSAVRVASETGEIMEIVLAAGLEMFEAEQGAIVVPDPVAGRLVLAQGKNWPDRLRTYSFSPEESLFGQVFESGKPHIVSDPSAGPGLHPLAKEIMAGENAAAGAAMYAPLLAGEEVKGIVALTHSAVGAFSQQELHLLTALAEIAGSALHRAGLMETLEQRVRERTQELAEANERLQVLDRLKSKFVSDVSHELRTPITNLNLYMDLLERGKTERSQRYWTVLRKQAERLNQLIEDILSLSRLELGRLQGEFAALDLNQLLVAVLADYRAEVEANGLVLRFRPDAGLAPVWGQREQLRSIISNLLENALNYTPTGSVSVSTARDGDKVLLAIEDSGVGIAAADLPHVFERFYRGQYASQSNIPGTGLGLAIVEEVVNIHEGQIAITSEEGEGTCVRIWLPQAAEED